MKFWQNYEFCVIKLRAKKLKTKNSKIKNKTKQNKKIKQNETKTKQIKQLTKNKCILIGSCEKSSEQFLAIPCRRQAQFWLGRYGGW